jgi:putative oxidoreductase
MPTPLNNRFALQIAAYFAGAARLLDFSSSLFQLALRLYIAKVFFSAGLTKIRDFSSTVALFENEYMVPLLAPWQAAMVGTAAELGLPILLLLGLASRPTALALFAFNAVAVWSYPDISPAGMRDHLLWGLILLVTVFYGPGRVSIDHLLKMRFARNN